MANKKQLAVAERASKKRSRVMRSLELFVGAGGLAIGASEAGFKHEAVFEWNKDACDTLNLNRDLDVEPVNHWDLVVPTDVRDVNFLQWQDKIDLLAGGPPCQPFSLGGKHQAYLDERDMFPQAIRAVRESRPRSFLIENVRGLTRSTFASYFEYILLQLNYPDLIQRKGETWADHLTRLEKYHTKGRPDGLHYRVVFQVVNAADYGVPQKRERVIIVGFRSDQKKEWSFPKATHSLDALLYDQWVTGEYFERHEVAKKDRYKLSGQLAEKVVKLKDSLFPVAQKPWKTVRDAIGDLPRALAGEETFLNHRFVPGAKIYPGHTGSPYDFPAKTIKAGGHGVPGGENMLALPNGTVRYFTVRESARLQTFPDGYRFSGSWGEAMRQLGNAVPVELGRVAAMAVMKGL
jgi:DNA (cytosine-5)-methyltransferase 1